ncbi:MAG: hypothetical protein V2B18_18795 [Pseudomonadota bacterium]
MRKVIRMTKVTRVLKIHEFVEDLRSDRSDEELLEKHDLSWEQLGKVYARLFYGGFLGPADIYRRIDMRGERDASHIPAVRLNDDGSTYECSLCGFDSPFHFSQCPRCRELNLRRLYRRAPVIPISFPVQYGAY